MDGPSASVSSWVLDVDPRACPVVQRKAFFLGGGVCLVENPWRFSADLMAREIRLCSTKTLINPSVLDGFLTKMALDSPKGVQ